MRPDVKSVIAVLGSRVRDGHASPVLSSRLDTATEQWRLAETRGTASYVFCLGGSGGDDRELEAPVMANQLVARGVARRFIIEEAFSRTTEENLLHLRAILSDSRFPDAWAGMPSANAPDPRALTQPTAPVHPAITIVTSRFHLPRTLLMARHLGFDATGVPAPTARSYALRSLPREIGALILWGARSLRRSFT